MTFVLGLTGSIGMGKSTTADFFRQQGAAVHDADKTVHNLYCGRAVPLIENIFPGVAIEGVIDRVRLAERVFDDPQALMKLEAVVHPLVADEQKAFLENAQKKALSLVIIDSPLLLETGQSKKCDAILVATAPFNVQLARVLSRPGMTLEKFNRIHVKQMPDAEKRRWAHFIIDTARGYQAAEKQVKDILRALSGRIGRLH